MRIATYNLLHGISLASGTIDLAAAAEAIAGLEADVVGVQEVDRDQPRTGGSDQVAELARHLGMHGLFAPALLGNPDQRWTGVRGQDPGGPAYGVGLLSRRPLMDPHRVALPGGGDGERSADAARRNPGWDREPRVALHARLEVDGTPIRVATAHLSYLPWRGLAQLAAAVRAVAATELPAALIGDFNLPAWPVRATIRDGWVHAGGQPTYPSWNPRVQVDQLLVRGGLIVHEVVVGPAATGDHLPLVATLSLPAASSAQGPPPDR